MPTPVLDLLACPRCRHRLEIMDAHTGLMCPQCRMVYPIRDEIPFLTREEAVPLQAWRSGARRPGEQPAFPAAL